MVLLQFICERCQKVEGQVIALQPGECTYINQPEGWSRETELCPECSADVEKEKYETEISDRLHEEGV